MEAQIEKALSKEARQTYKKAFRLLKSLFQQGYFEVVTPFKYQEKRYEFRTLVQPDADVLQYIPSLKALHADSKYRKLYLKKHQQHQNELADALSLFEPDGKGLGYVIDAFLLIGNLYSAYLAYLAGTLQDAFISGAILVVSALYRQYLKKPTIKALFKLLYRMVKLFLKWRKGKN